MNRLKISIIIIGQILFTGCIMPNKFMVQVNEVEPANGYKTFGVFKNTGDASKRDTFDIKLEKALRYQMELRGFKYKVQSPDLLLITQIIDHNPFKTRSSKQKTLGITIVNTKNRIPDWEGWAILSDTNEDFRSERNMKRAVMLIFDNYKVFADGFLINNGLFSKNASNREIRASR